MGETFTKQKDKIDPRIYKVMSGDEAPKNDTNLPPKVLLKKSEEQLRLINEVLLGSVPPGLDIGVLHSIKGIDGNNFNIKVFQPPPSKVVNPKKIPAIIYFHGGGMAIMNIEDYNNYNRKMSGFGLVVIAVDFRNSIESPFPSGLHDCLSAVLWTSEHVQELNIDPDRLVVGGESGGANLATATCLLAKSRGIRVIKGQYLNCPYLAPDQRYKSRHKYGHPGDPNLFAITYTNPNDFNNYLAWPVNATVEQLRGLPPTLVITNEIDILVHEGEHYFAKLMQAGVNVLGFRSLGTVHGSSLMGGIAPEISDMTFVIVSEWVKSLGQKQSKL